MSKMILVLDEPKDCEDCPLFREKENNPHQCEAKHKDVDMYTYYKNRPDWCPLRELPDKKEISHFCETSTDWQKGYNTCLDDILK